MTTKKRALVIDDEQDVRTFISTVLEDNGFEAVPAEDGEQALAELQRQAPDLITLDITMPNRSGVRFYRDVKENDATRHIPVVIVTGVDQKFEKFISTRRQVPPPEGYVQKPMSAEELLQAVEEAMTKARRG